MPHNNENKKTASEIFRFGQTARGDAVVVAPNKNFSLFSYQNDNTTEKIPKGPILYSCSPPIICSLFQRYWLHARYRYLFIIFCRPVVVPQMSDVCAVCIKLLLFS